MPATSKAIPRGKGDLKVKGDDKHKGTKEGDPKTEDYPKIKDERKGKGGAAFVEKTFVDARLKVG